MTTLATRMTPRITTMIRMDHSHVLAIFHRFKGDAPVSKKRALVTNACLALEVHAQLEEEIFYPALRAAIGADPVLEKSEPEHREMRRLIAELRQILGANGAGNEGALDDKFMDLMGIVIHHVADEETRLLPAAERLLGAQLEQLGREMTTRRVELLRPHAGELISTTIRSFPGAAAAGVLLTAGAVAFGAMLLSRSGRGASRARRIPRAR
jgi:Hemerythrin HHE cation binding domain